MPKQIRESAQTAKLSVTHAPIGHSKKGNWITHSEPGPGPGLGQMPAYLQNIRNALVRDGHSVGEATAIAIGTVKRWAAGGGKVHPEVRAAAGKALAEWEALRAKGKATKAVKKVTEAKEYRFVDVDGERWLARELGEGRVELIEMWSAKARVAAVAARRRGMVADEYTVKRHVGQLDGETHFSVTHPTAGTVSQHPSEGEAMEAADALNRQHSLGKYAKKPMFTTAKQEALGREFARSVAAAGM